MSETLKHVNYTGPEDISDAHSLSHNVGIWVWGGYQVTLTKVTAFSILSQLYIIFFLIIIIDINFTFFLAFDHSHYDESSCIFDDQHFFEDPEKC